MTTVEAEDIQAPSHFGDRVMILEIPQHEGWPKYRAGRYWWYPTLQTVAWVRKGQHNPTEDYALRPKTNTARGALRLALRTELERITSI